MSTTPTPRELERSLRREHTRYQQVALILTAFAVVLNIGIGIVVLASLGILRDATGPDADARQAEVIEGLVVRIDCRQRSTLQQVIDGLSEEGILDGDAVRVLLDECEALEMKPTTPTTSEENP